MTGQRRDQVLIEALIECLIGVWEGLPELPKHERTVLNAQLDPISREGTGVALSPLSGLSLLPPLGLAWFSGLGRTLERWETLDSSGRETAANVLVFGPGGQYQASRGATEIDFLDLVGVPRSDDASMGSYRRAIVGSYCGMWFDAFYKFYQLHPADQKQLGRSLTDSGLLTIEVVDAALVEATAIPATPNRRMSYGAAVDRGAAGLVRGSSVIEGDLFVTTRHLLFRETILGQQPSGFDEITAQVVHGRPAEAPQAPPTVVELPLAGVTSWQAKRMPLRVGFRRFQANGAHLGLLEVVVGSKFSANLAALLSHYSMTK